MENRQKKVIVILPAYNAEKTLEQTLYDIPKEWVDDIILVDDKSRDRTIALARKLGIQTFEHPHNRGYGGNQKTCYQKALEAGADIVVMVHPDHQYDPKTIPLLIQPLLDEKADAVFGSRMMIKSNALRGGMPYWKFFANIFLTFIENLFFRVHLTEYHSGFRAYSSKVLKSVPFEKNSDDFVFDTEIIVQIKLAGFRIQEIPIQTYYFPEASSISFLKSLQYGLAILGVIGKYVLHVGRLKIYKQFVVQ